MSDLHTRIITTGKRNLPTLLWAIALVALLSYDGIMIMKLYQAHYGMQAKQVLQPKSSNRADYPVPEGMLPATVTGPAEDMPPVMPGRILADAPRIPQAPTSDNPGTYIADPDIASLPAMLGVVRAGGGSYWQAIRDALTPSDQLPNTGVVVANAPAPLPVTDAEIANLIADLQLQMPGQDLNLVQPGVVVSIYDGHASVVTDAEMHPGVYLPHH